MQGTDLLDRRRIWPWHYRPCSARGVGIVLVGVAGLAVAAAAIWMSAGSTRYPWWVMLPVDAVGALFLGLGLLIWMRRPAGERLGLLLVAFALLWYLQYLQASSSQAVFDLGFWL